MSRMPHRLILASAGTGKTYQLSGHFLRLLLAGVEPERILATTFTRKAAGEILDRVLERLLEAATRPEKLAELAAQVPDVALDQGRVGALLAYLTRRLDRFRVRTLDSFFVHLAQLFALDLELPPEWTLVEELDDAELRAEVIGRVLAECSREERVELLRGLQRGAATRSVHAAMLSVVRDARELALESASDAWAPLPLPDAPDPEELPVLAARLAEVELPTTQKGTPNAHWRSNVERARRAVASGDWEDFLEITLVQRVIQGGTEFQSKPIPEATAEVLGELARLAATSALRAANEMTAACHAFLARFERLYQEAKRERGAYRFEDLPQALAPSASNADSWNLDERRLELWFRLDGRLDHLLLDEFQDTSPAQWRTLAPLAEEVLADGLGTRSFFCVGDVKQSIYGWRQAEPRLLQGLATRHTVLDPPATLSTSYRSAPVVLDTVNRVFGELGRSSLLVDDEQPAQSSAARAWSARFPAHQSKRVELPGAALLLEARFDDPEQRAADAVHALAVERVLALARQAPAATIGVLVRTGKPIPRLLQSLRAQGLLASGEGGNPLTDAESVQVFLSALHLADHPGDSAAALHVASSPLGPVLGLRQGGDADPDVRRAASRALRAGLARQGYGPFTAALLPAVEAAPAFSAWDVERFRQLVDQAYAHAPRESLRPTEFAERVRATSVEDPRASRVRVMTIHKSKGLEFDAVVLPELDGSLVRSKSTFLWSRPDPFGAIERVILRPRKAVLAFSRQLRELSEAVEERECSESLCVLYVAMTRAARRLEMILPPPPRSGKPSAARSYATLLRELLGGEEPSGDGTLWRHPDSREDWFAGLEEPEGEEEEHEQPPLRLASAERPRDLPRGTASALAEPRVRASEALRVRTSPEARLGTLVHRLFQEIGWLEDFAASDEGLLAVLASLEQDEATRTEALALFRRALESRDLRALLSRPAGPAWVRREQSFAVILPDEGGERLWSGSIDRLVLHGEPSHPSAAEVIDFKTDRVDAIGLAARVESHRPQLEAYRRVVAAQTGLAESSIACRLAFVTSSRVHTLPEKPTS